MFKNSKLFSLLLVLLGNTIYALSVKLFLLPANLISCGTTGIALVVNHLTGMPLSSFIFLFNLVMLVVGLIFLGKKFALTTVFSSLFYPLALEVLNRLLGDIQITQDYLLNTLFAGLSLGLSLEDISFNATLALVLNKLFHIPVSATLWCFDFCIMLAQASFHTLEDLLYGILLLMVISFSLNKVLLLGTSRTEVKIISAKSDDIRLAILTRVDRGVTILHGEGGYLRSPTEVILSVVSNHEMPKIERVAREIDPECFIIVSRVTEVWGRGFSVSKHYKRE